jgi:hypothetical protein
MKTAKKFIAPFFLVWIFLGFLTLPYNAVNIISEIKTWFPLTDTQKRQKIFGDMYDFAQFITKHTEENARILVVSREDNTGLVINYYTIPRIVKYVKEENQISREKIKEYDYLISYNNNLKFKNLYPFARYNSLDSKRFGIIYKIR